MQINNLNIAFKDNVVYKDFSLSIDNQKITCILGPSGCGKTTLLNAIVNNVDYVGDIFDVEKCAYVFQSPRLIESINVEKNLRFVNQDGDVDKVLSDLQIMDCKYKFPKQISGGQASRVALARALLYNPKMLLLDEPFKELDILLKKNLIDLFRNVITNNNLGAVYVTHNVDEALSIADRVIVLKGSPVEIALDIEIEGDHSDLSADNLNTARSQIYSVLTN